MRQATPGGSCGVWKAGKRKDEGLLVAVYFLRCFFIDKVKFFSFRVVSPLFVVFVPPFLLICSIRFPGVLIEVEIL